MILGLRFIEVHTNRTATRRRDGQADRRTKGRTERWMGDGRAVGRKVVWKHCVATVAVKLKITLLVRETRMFNYAKGKEKI